MTKMNDLDPAIARRQEELMKAYRDPFASLTLPEREELAGKRLAISGLGEIIASADSYKELEAKVEKSDFKGPWQRHPGLRVGGPQPPPNGNGAHKHKD